MKMKFKLKLKLKENAPMIVESTKLVPGQIVKSADLKVGETYFCYYRNAGQNFSQIFKFTGFSDAEKKYGKSGPVFNTLKDVKNKYNIKNMKDLEQLSDQEGRDYGQNIYMCGKFEDGSEGCFFYAYKGSWVRGSGADKLTFYSAVNQPNETF